MFLNWRILNVRLAIFGFWFLTIVLVVLGPIASTHASLMINIIAILLFPVVFIDGGYREVWHNGFFKLCLPALGVLLLCFGFTAEQPSDLLSIFNFIPFLLAAPVFLLAKRYGFAGGKLVLYFFLAGAAAATMVGIVDVFFRGYARTEGFHSGAIIIGRMGVVFGFISGALFFAETGYRRFFGVLGPLLALIATMLSGSRGVVLSIPPAAALLAFFMWRARGVPGSTRISPTAIVLLIGLIAIPLTWFIGGNLGNLGSLIAWGAGGFSSDVDQSTIDSATSYRMGFYLAGLELFFQSPWLGYGWADIPDAAFTILNETDYNGEFSVHFFHFHNDVLNFAVAAGVPGIVVLAAFVLAPVVGAAGMPKDALFTARLCAASTLSLIYAVSGLTDITFGYDMPTTAFAMSSALILGGLTARA